MILIFPLNNFHEALFQRLEVVEWKCLWSVLHRFSLLFQCPRLSASDCHFLLSVFILTAKVLDIQIQFFLKACSLIQVFNWLYVATAALNFLIHRSFIYCWIFHCVLDRTSIVCYPQEGLFPLYISCLLLVLCVSMLYCSYLDCSRWEGLWPALNLTKIKQPASWIIYIFKSLPLLFIAHSLHQISPSRPPPVTSQSLFSPVLLSHWHILRYVNLTLNIWYFCEVVLESILISRILFLEPFCCSIHLIHTLFSFSPS